jgi:hypothetical protein
MEHVVYGGFDYVQLSFPRLTEPLPSRWTALHAFISALRFGVTYYPKNVNTCLTVNRTRREGPATANEVLWIIIPSG